MPKVKRPQIKGPDYDDDDYVDAAPRRAPRRPCARHSLFRGVVPRPRRDLCAGHDHLRRGDADASPPGWAASLGAFGNEFQQRLRRDRPARPGCRSEKIERRSALDPLVEEQRRAKWRGVHVGGNILAADPYAIRQRDRKARRGLGREGPPLLAGPDHDHRRSARADRAVAKGEGERLARDRPARPHLRRGRSAAISAPAAHRRPGRVAAAADAGDSDGGLSRISSAADGDGLSHRRAALGREVPRRRRSRLAGTMRSWSRRSTRST